MEKRKVFKYATGQEVPENAIYLWSCKNGDMPESEVYASNYQFVWHYFLVEVGETN